MSKFDDRQIDITSVASSGSTTVLHAPAGSTPAHGADAPNVSSKVVLFSAGKQANAISGTAAGVRYANPA